MVVGISAFVATNIDNIFLLMMFFSSSYSSSMTFPLRQIVLGQYLGISLLIAISALGSLNALVVPPYFIGLLGIVPIAIGSKRLLQTIMKKDNVSSYLQTRPPKESSKRSNKEYLPFWLWLP
jgi:cadmium resistance protein CadD (predicted permease)